MGRQIQINATVNDIRQLFESVKKDYPTLCRLERNGRGMETTMVVSENPWGMYGPFYITTKEIYYQIKKEAEDYDLNNPDSKHNHYLDFQDQCVEIIPNIYHNRENHLISGSLERYGRIYVDTERTEAVDRLYSCFVKYTKRMTVKYKDKNPKAIFLLHSFPEADMIIKDYLLNEGDKKDCYRIIIPTDTRELFLSKQWKL